MSAIAFCDYQMEPNRRLSAARGGMAVRGCLVRAGGGVACLQTWPELGEPALAEVLEDFRGPRALAISRQAWACCRLDGEARRAGVHLLQGRRIPQSHFTLPWGGADVPAGFHAVKVKAGRDAGELLRVLGTLPAGVRIRLDFNETLQVDEFRQLWRALQPYRERIDFVEDPVPYELDAWRGLEAELGCRLAVDRHTGEAPFLRVWKPARAALLGTGDVVVTSNMDHPVGQVFAAVCAAERRDGRRVFGCGLVTHHLFDPADPFVARMGPPRPDFPRLPGTGLGFDDLLEQLPWRTW